MDISLPVASLLDSVLNSTHEVLHRYASDVSFVDDCMVLVENMLNPWALAMTHLAQDEQQGDQCKAAFLGHGSSIDPLHLLKAAK
jgi:hypothetical protein